MPRNTRKMDRDYIKFRIKTVSQTSAGADLRERVEDRETPDSCNHSPH